MVAFEAQLTAVQRHSSHCLSSTSNACMDHQVYMAWAAADLNYSVCLMLLLLLLLRVRRTCRSRETKALRPSTTKVHG
jgi:hypothetical protein